MGVTQLAIQGGGEHQRHRQRTGLTDLLGHANRRFGLLLGLHIVAAQARCPALQTGRRHLRVIAERQPFEDHRMVDRIDLIQVLARHTHAAGPELAVGTRIIGQATIAIIGKLFRQLAEARGQREGIGVGMTLAAADPQAPLDDEGLFEVRLVVLYQRRTAEQVARLHEALVGDA